MEYTSEQKDYMKRALRLAEKARGFTEPNPLTGAVIVKDGNIVGEGYHKKAGTPHAEINALSEARGSAMGATMYVTLEPCSHYGKTPPCANALVRAGIKEVFIAMEDPNPLVNGKGIVILEKAGLRVHLGLLREEAKRQNEIFLTNQIKKRAFIALKSAQTIDGKIGPKSGRPLRITAEAAREYSHSLRNRYGAVLVGVNTVIKDDPTLNIRYNIDHPDDRPTRIVLDPHMRMAVNAKILNREDGPILIYTAEPVSSVIKKKIEAKGGNICVLPDKNGNIDLKELPKDLLRRNICAVLVEGGAETFTRFFTAGMWDIWHCFVAPKLLGKDGIDVFSKSTETAIPLNAASQSVAVGEDLLIEYRNHSGVTSCLPE
ncbi:MAG TPA: bifunctional diaminohydroxyphosphoribosylaminopyrimidine deaminase/5-amino-6-(5-phosphoribosylamino)uracil reductase RibD [Clostridiales bacterium]|nr:bifunctional diaminohydroxyphosphoribosylaminopyrimidine deaminase/5-amino-6-(5-phosphoribosylamino)uracil reductase RibD [Clostridiales bacterium]